MPTRYDAPQCASVYCPLHLTCSRVATEINTDPVEHPDGTPLDLLFIGDYPGIQEFRARAPYRGYEGTIIRDMMKSYAPNKSYALTYTIKGLSIDVSTLPPHLQNNSLMGINTRTLEGMKQIPLASHKEKEYIIRNCMPFTQQIIEKYRPRKIVLLGNLTFKAFFPRESKSITEVRGTDMSLNGIPTMVLPSPGIVAKNPSAKPEWESNFRSVITGVREVMDKKMGSTILVKTMDEAKYWIDKIKNFEGVVGIDTETHNLNKRYGNKLATVQIALDNNSAIVFPFHHRESPFLPNEIEALIPLFYDLFNGETKIKTWIGHHIKFENHILRGTFGTILSNAPVFDTMVGAFLLDENRMERAASFKYGVYTLKQLVYDYLQFDGYNKGILKTREEGSLVDLTLEELANYGAMDAYKTRELYFAELRESERQGFTGQFKSLNMQLYNLMIELFTEIEYNGFYVDLPHLRTLIGRNSPILKRMREIEEELKSIPEAITANALLLNAHPTQAGKGIPVVKPLAGTPWIFNFAKQNHPQTLFFQVMGLTPLKTGESGRGSVDEDFQETNQKYPLVKIFNEWILMSKMLSSFASKLYDILDPSGQEVDSNTDGRVRANFHVAKIVTGRAASSDPNLQAIPRAENEAKKAIKNIFCSPKGEALIQFDYKANEMRWVGILAQDVKMAGMFKQGKIAQMDFRKDPTPEKGKLAKLLGDIHKMNASKAFQKDITLVTDDERQKAKGISFGVLYDSSYESISDLYGIPLDEVKVMFENFYAEYYGIARWKALMKDNASRYGYVEAPTGRRRRFPVYDLYRDPYSGVFMWDRVPREHKKMIAEAARQASNAPVQGIASDAAYIGTGLFLRYVKEKRLPVTIVNAVHDSVVLTTPISMIEEVIHSAEYWLTEGVMSFMSDSFGINFNLPIEVEAEVGTHWGDLKKWDGSKPHMEKLTAWVKEGCIGGKSG